MIYRADDLVSRHLIPHLQHDTGWSEDSRLCKLFKKRWWLLDLLGHCSGRFLCKSQDKRVARRIENVGFSSCTDAVLSKWVIRDRPCKMISLESESLSGQALIFGSFACSVWFCFSWFQSLVFVTIQYVFYRFRCLVSKVHDWLNCAFSGAHRYL
jgi:hypothetical protein